VKSEVPVLASGSPNQPTTSPCTSTSPDRLKTDIRPDASSWATTRFGTVDPGPRFRFDVGGLGSPAAHAVRFVVVVAPVPVRLSTTADAPDAGTPAWPATSTSIVVTGPSGASGTPVPLRVSRLPEPPDGVDHDVGRPGLVHEATVPGTDPRHHEAGDGLARTTLRFDVVSAPVGHREKFRLS
jgi:hypothetical protein